MIILIVIHLLSDLTTQCELHGVKRVTSLAAQFWRKDVCISLCPRYRMEAGDAREQVPQQEAKLGQWPNHRSIVRKLIKTSPVHNYQKRSYIVLNKMCPFFLESLKALLHAPSHFIVCSLIYSFIRQIIECLLYVSPLS